MPVNTTESLEVRRARVLAKLNTRGTTTVRAIQETDVGKGRSHGQPVKDQVAVMLQQNRPEGCNDVKNQVGGLDFLNSTRLRQVFVCRGSGCVFDLPSCAGEWCALTAKPISEDQLNQHRKSVVLKMLYHIALPPGDDLHHIEWCALTAKPISEDRSS